MKLAGEIFLKNYQAGQLLRVTFYLKYIQYIQKSITV